MPAEPQHSSHSRGSTSVTPGMPRSRSRGGGPDALGVGEVAGVVVGDGQLERVPGRLRRGWASSSSCTSRTLAENAAARSAHSGSSASRWP